MTQEEFAGWLGREVEDGRMTPAQRDDLLDQKAIFDEREPFLRERYRNRIVAYVAGNLMSASDIHELMEAANAEFPGRMVYFEPIGFDLF